MKDPCQCSQCTILVAQGPRGEAISSRCLSVGPRSPNKQSSGEFKGGSLDTFTLVGSERQHAMLKAPSLLSQRIYASGKLKKGMRRLMYWRTARAIQYMGSYHTRTLSL